MACEEAGVILNLVKILCHNFGLLTDLGFKDAWYMHLQWTLQPTAQDSVLTPGSFSSQVRSSQEAIQELGLGTWRLRGRVGGPFEALAAQIEGAWRQYFSRELCLYPLPEVFPAYLCTPWHLCRAFSCCDGYIRKR